MFAFKERIGVTDLADLVDAALSETTDIELAPATIRDKELRIGVNLTSTFFLEKTLGGNLGEVDHYILCLNKKDMGANIKRALECCKGIWEGKVDGAEVEVDNGKNHQSPQRHRVPISVVFVQDPPSKETSTQPSADPPPALDIDSETDKWWQENKDKFHDSHIYPQGVLCIPSVVRPFAAPTPIDVRKYLEKLVSDHALRAPPLPPTAQTTTPPAVVPPPPPAVVPTPPKKNGKFNFGFGFGRKST